MKPASFFRALVLFGIILGLERASGAQVNWGTTRLATNYTSDLKPLGQDTGFTFEVGAFADGFVPTAGNAEQWAANWIAADSGSYNSTLAFATGSVSKAATIPAGAKGYLWGFDAREGAVEWILVSDASWVWGANEAGDKPVDWTVGAAGESVVGEINGTFHMQTAAFDLNATSADPQAWLAENFPGETDSPIAAWDADADQDGVPNALEFAFGTSPRDLTAVVRAQAVPVQTAAGKVMSVVFDGVPSEGVALNYEVSTDLQNWADAGDSVEVRTEAGQLVIEDKVPTSVLRRFIRVTVEL